MHRHILETMLDEAGIGFCVVDPELRYVHVNGALARLVGLRVEEIVGRPVRDVLPDLADRWLAVLTRVLRSGEPVLNVDVWGPAPAGPGVRRQWSQSVYPARTPDGTVVGVGVLVREVADQQRSQQELERLLRAEQVAKASATAATAVAEAAVARLQVLQNLTSALAEASGIDQVGRIVADTVAVALGASVSLTFIAGGNGRLRPLVFEGLRPGGLLDWENNRELIMKIVEGLRERGQAVFACCKDELTSHYPDLVAAVRIDSEAWALLPLPAHGRVVGVAAFGWRESHAFSVEERGLLVSLAAQMATALERARLFAAETSARSAAEEAQTRLSLLSEASATMADASGSDEMLARVAEILATSLDCRCEIVLPDEAGVPRTVLHRCGADHLDLSLGVSALHQQVWQARAPVLLSADGHQGEVHTLAVPLMARRQVLGVLTLLRRGTRAAFTGDDMLIMADLGRRMGATFDTLSVLEARTRVAARLQEDLLPDELPTARGLDFAATYVAAEDAAEVGGDFYDAFPLGDSAVSLIIGDVSGRGVDAAGLTGLARTTLRALGPDTATPVALTRLNTLLLARTGPEQFLTAAYLKLWVRDEHAVSLTVCLAGHPPPLVLRADGRVEAVGVPGSLLGVFEDIDLVERTVELSVHDVVLLYTDGAIEAHGRDGLFGQERLMDCVSRLGGRSAREVVSSLQRAILAYRTAAPDDLALLAVRVVPVDEPEERLVLETWLAADAVAVSEARRVVSSAAVAVLDDEELSNLVISVSELVTNAVNHLARDPNRTLRSRPIQLRLFHRGDMLRAEVNNPGRGFELPTSLPAVDSDTGRGLYLVQAVTSHLCVTTSSGTTCVSFEVPCAQGPRG